MRNTTTGKTLRRIGLGLAASLAIGGAASAESVPRVAMTAGDIPLTIGQPDQGFEGDRFVGYKLYDALLLRDLSQGETEATARDAMMLNFKTVMISDGNAASSDEEHMASLIAVYLTFGDVMRTDETIACLRANAAGRSAA